MKHLAIVAALALSLGACTPEQVQQDETYVLSIVASIKAGAKVAEATAASAVDVVCGYMPAVVNDANSIRTAIGMTGLTPGVKTQLALSAADSAVSAVNNLCATRSATGNPAKVAAAWAAYANAKAALAAAKKAAGA